MKRYFVDTNLFVRYLTADDPAKADRVDTLLNKAVFAYTRECMREEFLYQLSAEAI